MYLKARELYQQNAIGKLNMVEAWLDRQHRDRRVAIHHSARCEYEPHIDWDRFLGSAPKRPFDADSFVPLAQFTSTTARAWRATCLSIFLPACTP